ncbi:MAG: hypothetical protein B7Y05_00770 [Polynucleobacter sp. 24-46-87]|jgi:hypothetical protein|uniref:DUF6352 family protein n=1 Tax=unclassified Polynucleobacter TaxID=2640945 RepID=UPI000BDC098F|nr:MULTISPECIES: DUF6352 family protein [unclassified Polynucleobacter]OYY21343.1 MAG: hypothetical protein B7Y67_02245 [Polynucleobacter sp. 35-46-11]OZA16217.1 MAG: hypothetical protein B7Y05_00770 [Polynucleobacter sp. 24-46-87]OZA76475.1 MAG: hypothetical protein B7X71_08225 [Polynucleobacter sp. 39-46-10]
MTNFWPHCAYKTLTVGSDKQLQVTDDFLRTYLLRPELNLVPESCAAERALHQRLIDNPRAAISDEEIAGMADPDIQVNYQVWLRYRAKLLAASSLENFYMSLFKGDGVDVPPLFISQLAQIFIRHILGEDCHPLDARMGELFFRVQKITVLEDSVVMGADDEVVTRNAQAGETGNILDLLKSKSMSMRSIDLDVLHEENADLYWEKNEDHDFAVQLNFGQPPINHFCRVLEKWVQHFLGAQVRITPMQQITDPKWSWHVGLDAAATDILNKLYNKEPVDSDELEKVICLFRLDFVDEAAVTQSQAGKPVYMGIAMNDEGQLKLKPQNLLFNLPLAKAS